MIGLILAGPYLLLLGAFGLIVFGAFRGLRAFRSGNGHRGYIKKFTGVVCGGALAYFLYIPGGPDPCSRVITDTQYEKCLENIFSDMSFPETRHWLEQYGYRTFQNLKGGFEGRPALGIEDGVITFRYDKWFETFRDHGPTKSVPYGTNFNRFFARMWPAPDSFRLNIFGWEKDDNIIRARVSWGFSFL